MIQARWAFKRPDFFVEANVNPPAPEAPTTSLDASYYDVIAAFGVTDPSDDLGEFDDAVNAEYFTRFQIELAAPSTSDREVNFRGVFSRPNGQFFIFERFIPIAEGQQVILVEETWEFLGANSVNFGVAFEDPPRTVLEGDIRFTGELS